MWIKIWRNTQKLVPFDEILEVNKINKSNKFGVSEVSKCIVGRTG